LQPRIDEHAVGARHDLADLDDHRSTVRDGAGDRWLSV
jgi:hypothetical protein